MLTSERVEIIYKSCLFSTTPNVIDQTNVIHGIMSKTLFDPERIEQHRKEIDELLDELPEGFHEKTGGGWSFLQACVDKNGNQWTGMHLTMDRLFQLGMAIGKVEYVFDNRDLWQILPGGMPYIVIKEKPK
jgi:hypothetical protein